MTAMDPSCFVPVALSRFTFLERAQLRRSIHHHSLHNHPSQYSKPLSARLPPIRHIRTTATTTPPSGPPAYPSPSDPRRPSRFDGSTTQSQSSSSPPTTVNVDADEDSAHEIENELLELVAGLNRGFIGSNQVKDQVRDLVKVLEGKAGKGDKLQKLQGQWRLVWTDALDILSLCALPGLQVGDVYQNVAKDDSDGKGDYVIDNVVDLESKFAPLFNAFVGSSVARVKVSATGVVAEGDDEDDNKIDITFKNSAFTPLTLFGSDISERFPPLKVPLRSPVGFIKTTFIDNRLRIARAPRSLRSKDAPTIFILLRVHD